MPDKEREAAVMPWKRPEKSGRRPSPPPNPWSRQKIASWLGYVCPTRSGHDKCRA